jgi:hypothetical protein
MPKIDYIQNPQDSLSYYVLLLNMTVFLETWGCHGADYCYLLGCDVM